MRIVFALLLLWSVSLPAAAVEPTLEKIAAAATKLNYSGVFFFQHDDTVRSFRIVHAIDQGSEREKLVKLDGAQREIIRNNDDVQCYFPDANSAQQGRVQLRRSFPALLPEQLATLNANYLISRGPIERVAGLQAQVLLLTPRDGLRYAHKLWVDTASDLLLRFEMLNDEQKVIEQTSFSEIAIGGNIDKDAFSPSLAVKGVRKPVEALQGSDSGWRVAELPAGFRKMMETKRNFRGKPYPVLHLVYSDGIVSVSVFIEPWREQEKSRLGLSKYGAVNLYSHVSGDSLVTVVGEVPAAAAMQIGNSLIRGK